VPTIAVRSYKAVKLAALTQNDLKRLKCRKKGDLKLLEFTSSAISSPPEEHRHVSYTTAHYHFAGRSAAQTRNGSRPRLTMITRHTDFSSLIYYNSALYCPFTTKNLATPTHSKDRTPVLIMRSYPI